MVIPRALELESRQELHILPLLGNKLTPGIIFAQTIVCCEYSWNLLSFRDGRNDPSTCRCCRNPMKLLVIFVTRPEGLEAAGYG